VARRVGILSSHLWFEISSMAGGMLALGSLSAFVIAGVKQQQLRYDAENRTGPPSSLRVVEPTAHAALKAPTTSRKRRRGELELLPPSSTVNFADDRRAADIDGCWPPSSAIWSACSR
jgi:hypothetical protein